MREQDLRDAHSALSPDVRDVEWISNCAGEIFLAGEGEEEDEEGLRIGHFQGDATLAAFVVTVHNAMLAATSSEVAV